MGKKFDILGSHFGKLTVVGEVGKDNDGNIMWECICDCGGVVTVRSCSLRKGRTKSCGCLQKDTASKTHSKHGMYTSRIYKIYHKMKDRCYNKDSSYYYCYGGKGISVCDRWLESFENFLEDVSEGYADSLEIDRIDNNGNYAPDNFRWVTRQQNNFNRGSERNSTSKFKGVSWDKSRNKWLVQISKKGCKKVTKRFTDEIEAALFYNKLSLEFFGEFAYLNIISEVES